MMRPPRTKTASRRCTVLHGVAAGHLISALLERFDARDIEATKDFSRPADLAARRGHGKLAMRLLGGEDTEAVLKRCRHRDRNGVTILHHAATKYSTLLPFLLQEGGMSSSEAGTLSGRKAFHYAAEFGITESLKLLIENARQAGNHGAASEADSGGITPLHSAVANGHCSCIELLCSEIQQPQGAMQWPSTKRWETPLHFAGHHPGNADALKVLLKKGCPVDRQAEHGCTALHNVATSGDTTMAKVLLEWKSQAVQPLNDGKYEALEHAACQGHLEIVKLLVGNGADVNNRNIEGKTPFLVAAEGSLALSFIE